MPKVPKTNELNEPNGPNEHNKQNKPYVFTAPGLLVGILVIGICLSFEICYLEFPLTQLLREWIHLPFHPRYCIKQALVTPWFSLR
jgi:hypothetical protein